MDFTHNNSILLQPNINAHSSHRTKENLLLTTKANATTMPSILTISPYFTKVTSSPSTWENAPVPLETKPTPTRERKGNSRDQVANEPKPGSSVHLHRSDGRKSSTPNDSWQTYGKSRAKILDEPPLRPGSRVAA